jgi:CDP-4-dehydro-6-deoxyglucose reductase
LHAVSVDYDNKNNVSLKDRFIPYLQHQISWSMQTQQAQQHIYPHFAFVTRLQSRIAIGNTNANQLFWGSQLYLPGVGRNHSLVLGFNYQTRDTLRQYSFPNGFAMARGYQAFNYPRMWRYSANYHFPVIYPDLGIGNIVYFLRVRGADRFDFKPGQFVTLDLPIHEKPNKRWRSYSIASAPQGNNQLELVIVLDQEGVGTPWIFNYVEPGHVFTFRGPQGVFVLPEPTPAQPLFFICTGTGIAPFRSMLHDILPKSNPTQAIHLVFGCRNEADLLYADEMIRLQEQYPHFSYHPVLSRGKWDGHTGYVHDVYARLCAEHPDALFYLCGWKDMIDEARKRLQSLGYDKRQIHFELYG